MSDSDDAYGPALPPGLQAAHSKPTDSASDDDDSYGPAMPPKHAESTSTGESRLIGPAIPAHLSKRKSYSSDSESDSDSDEGSSKRPRVIGPCIPHNYKKDETSSAARDEPTEASSIGPQLPPHLRHLHETPTDIGPRLPASGSVSSGDDDNDVIGPSLGLKAGEHDTSNAGREFELRAEKMKEKLTGKSEGNEGPITRENWMTELPDNMGVKFGLGPRQFRKNAAPEQDSSWTDTPEDKARKEREGKSGKKDKKDRTEHLPSEADLRAAREIEEYNKKHRSESLLEMHEKERKKKKKKEKKKNKDKKPERRPFDREVDLQVNRLDDAQRRAIIKRSQDLGSRFQSGGTGTSFL